VAEVLDWLVERARAEGYHSLSTHTVEVFGPGDTGHEHFDAGPVAGFLVDDVREARADLEAAGISFLSPVQESDDGAAWSHFRGPDGNVYEVTTPAEQG